MSVVLLFSGSRAVKSWMWMGMRMMNKIKEVGLQVAFIPDFLAIAMHCTFNAFATQQTLMYS
jgi:hypothetical protein